MTEGENVFCETNFGTLEGESAALRELSERLRFEALAEDLPLPCLASLCPALDDESIERGATASAAGMLGEKLPAVDDVEGPRLNLEVAAPVDAHVHLFPDPLFDALWRWFDAYGWPIRYRLRTPEVVSFLQARGVETLVALHYAHKPGMASSLNAYMAEVVDAHPRVVGLATVFPGEEGASEILHQAFDEGRQGVKLHCHVQAFAADSEKMEPVYATCVARDRPLVMHAGREPKSPQYPVDTHAVCSADRIEAVLQAYPSLKLVVPHLGADEFGAYASLLDRYDNLWLDTTMMAANYFATQDVVEDFVLRRPDRVLYGTDFPNLPYAWDREAKRLSAKHFDDETAERLFSANARALFDIPPPA